jgi:hypothetical protein
VNTTEKFDPAVLSGGTKWSEWGCENGLDAVREFTETKERQTSRCVGQPWFLRQKDAEILRQRASSGYTRGKHHLEVRSTKMPKSDRGDATFEQLETVEQAWQRYYETKGDNMSPHCVEIAKSAFFTAFLAAQSAG